MRYFTSADLSCFMINIRMVNFGQETNYGSSEGKVISTDVKEELMVLVNGILRRNDNGFCIKASFTISIRNEMYIRSRVLVDSAYFQFMPRCHLQNIIQNALHSQLIYTYMQEQSLDDINETILLLENFYFLYSIFMIQSMSCLRQEPLKKRYKQLVVLQKYMYIQRQIQENSVRLFQKFHGNSQKHWSPNPSNYLSQENSKEKIHTQTNDSSCSHQASGQSTLRHVNTNPAVLNSFRKIVKRIDKSFQKLPSSYLSNSYQMMTDQKQANLQQRIPTERRKKARHTYNAFVKQNSLLQRSSRLSSFKGHQEEKSPTLNETTIMVKISMLKKEKWNIISKKTIDSSDSLLVRPPPFAFNTAQMKQPVKLKRNYSNMYQIYGINQSRKKVQNGKIEGTQDEQLSTGRIEPWSDQNS